MFEFKNPMFLVLLPLTIVFLIFYWRIKEAGTFRFSSYRLIHGMPSTWKVKYRFIPNLLRLIVLTLFIIALAGPRIVLKETTYTNLGVDIVLAVDISGSMAAEDFIVEGNRQNRLETVKSVISEFVAKRVNDRIGLVAFAGLAYTVCPLTTDYTWLDSNLERIDLGLIEDGTAIGSAIASSVIRLKSSDAKSKIIILLTDGINNAGDIDPVSAAKAAKTNGIKIYTIGAGSKGLVPFPYIDMFGRKVYGKVEIGMDEETLKNIADNTGGRFFRAIDTQELRKIYDEIDSLEKSEILEQGYFDYNEIFGYFLLASLIILLLELILSRTLFLVVP